MSPSLKPVRDRTVVFWQNFVSMHQRSLLRSLALTPGLSINVVVEQFICPIRQVQGWSFERASGVSYHCLSSLQERRRFVAELPLDAVHIFSGLAATPLQAASLVLCALRRDTIHVMAERPIHMAPAQRTFKWLKYRALAILLKPVVRSVLCIGRGAVDWYSSVGFPRSRLYDFGYYIDASEPFANGIGEGEDRFVIAYVGSASYRKGTDLLQHLTDLQAPMGVRLLSFGSACLPGPWENSGVHPNNEVRRRLMDVDVVIVPSRFDGWGMAVNEALLAGCRVVASDAVGAATLIEASSSGRLFSSGNVDDMLSALTQEIHKGKLDPEERSANRDWMLKNACGCAGASQLLSALDLSR